MTHSIPEARRTMALQAGSKLGPYEILSPIGKGGMGEVYRAKDTRLDRDIAIKVLPSLFSTNAQLKQRLQREAKAISNLSHPNICTLHDIGSEDGVDYLVMEFLEGETLAQRLAKEALLLEQVLRIGMEIASALATAHRAGVVHRDLKPGNIMLTKSGAKLLDFGLAKHEPGKSELSSAPDAATMTEPLTDKGTIVGTFQYMAPEQLEGAEADARTDIFAFGAVLYEMATGQRAFSGRSRASLITSIMTASPVPICEVQPMNPPALDHIVRSCFAKDPDDRIQTAHDLRLQLEWIAEGGSQAGVPVPIASYRRKQQRLAWSLTAIFGAVAIVMTAGYVREVMQPKSVIRSSITAPEGARFDSVGMAAGALQLSPDGKRAAFVASEEDGTNRVWVRSLDRVEATPLTSTDGATRPFWSADSRSIGFFADGKLKRVDAAGGPALALCDAFNGRGGTWNRDGVILFAPHFQSPIHSILDSGGTSTAVTELDPTKHGSHRWPVFMPDGKHFLYLAVSHNPAMKEHYALFLASIDDPKAKQVLHTNSNAFFASGYLVFARETTLMAQPFDPTRGMLSGNPTPIAESVRIDRPSWVGVYSVSQNGLLAFQTGESLSATKIVRMDRKGNEIDVIAQEDMYFNVRLSPDETRLVVSAGEGLSNIWIYELARGMRTRLTFDPIIQFGPIWSPDGNHIVYSEFISDPKRVLRRSAHGLGQAEVVMEDAELEMYATDWSSDGKYVLFLKGDIFQAASAVDIWAKPMVDDRPAFPILSSSFPIAHASFSPDGRWIAYGSTESERSEVYVIPFVDPGDAVDLNSPAVPSGRWQVSTNSGYWPMWRGDGKELFYLANDKYVTAAAVNGEGDSFVVSSTEKLFSINLVSLTPSYDVASDGQSFVVNMHAWEATTPITLVTNWPEELRSK